MALGKLHNCVVSLSFPICKMESVSQNSNEDQINIYLQRSCQARLVCKNCLLSISFLTSHLRHCQIFSLSLTSFLLHWFFILGRQEITLQLDPKTSFQLSACLVFLHPLFLFTMMSLFLTAKTCYLFS